MAKTDQVIVGPSFCVSLFSTSY